MRSGVGVRSHAGQRANRNSSSFTAQYSWRPVFPSQTVGSTLGYRAAVSRCSFKVERSPSFETRIVSSTSQTALAGTLPEREVQHGPDLSGATDTDSPVAPNSPSNIESSRTSVCSSVPRELVAQNRTRL